MELNEDSESVAPRLFGTEKFPDARDLSEHVVHLTPTPENLANILVTGRIEARNPHGLGLYVSQVRPLHLSVCFTESPITELARIANGKGSYGIGFKHDFIKQKSGQRVWYLDQGSFPLAHINTMMGEARKTQSWDADIWKVTPFIDKVIPRRYDFTHEREWRVAGERGLRFEWADLAFILTPDGTYFEVNEEPALSRPVQDHEQIGLYEWLDGSLPEIDARMNKLEEAFHAAFVNMEEANLYYDREDPDGFSTPGYERFDTCDAVEHAFDDYPVEVRLALQDHLDLTSPSGRWIRTAEIEEFEQEANAEYRDSLDGDA